MLNRFLSRRTAVVFIALTVPLGIFAVGATPAQAVAGDPPVTGVAIQLLEIQASQQNDPRASVSIVDRLAPGSTAQRQISVRNVSDSAQTVYVYTTAASIAGGAFVGAATEQNDLARWTTADRTEVALAAGGSAELTVTIDIPADAPEGEQYAAIWAEVRSALDPTTSVTSITRSGLRVYLAVGAGNGAAPDFSIDSLTANRSADGNPTVQANVTNTGGRAIELTGSLALAAGPGGLAAGPVSVDSPISLAPGESGQVAVTLDAALPAGPWDATLTLTGAEVTHDRMAQLTFPAVGTVDDAARDAGFLSWLQALWLAGWPWFILGFVVVLALAAVAIGLGIKLRVHAGKTA